jgi:general secretion pathway protein D
MLSSHRLAIFTVILLSLALFSRPLPAKKTVKPDKELAMAIEAEHAGDFETALELIQAALAKKPGELAYQIPAYRIRFECGAMLVHRAILLRNTGDLNGALTMLEKATKVDPSSDQARQEINRTKKMILRNEKGEPADGTSANDEGKAEDLKALTPAEMEKRKEAEKIARILPIPEIRPANPEPINLKMVNQRPKVLFDTVGKVFGVNVIFDPDYEGQNTIKQSSIELANATITEAFDDIAVVTKSYWKVLTPNTIFVTLDNRQKRQEYEEQVVKVFYLQNVGQQAELNEAVTVLRTVADIQKIFTSTPMNAIIIRAAADKIPLAEKLIAAIDKPKSEVIIDVMIMSVNRNYMRNLTAAIGVGGINSPITFTPRTSLQGQAQSTTTNSTTGTTTTTTTGTVTGNSTNNTLLLPDIKRISTSDYTISNVPGGLVEALLSDASTKVIQTPQIRALDNWKSSMKIGEKIPTATGSFQPGVGGVGVNPLVNTQFTYLDVGVNVDINPRVNSATDVSAHVAVEVSQEDSTVSIGGISQPVIGQKRMELDLRMKDGEINIIGGLISDEVDNSISGVPGLASIPLLGNLFKSNQVTKTQQELLVVMVPHIIRSPDITDEDLRAVATGNETSFRLSYAPPKSAKAPASSTPGPSAGAPPATAPATPPPGMPAPGMPAPGSPVPGMPLPGIPAPAINTPAPSATLPPGIPAPPVPGAPAPGPGAAAPPGTAPSGPLSVVLTATPQEVASGSTVAVSIQVNNAADLAAVQMGLKFDPKILRISNVTGGDLIRRNGPDLVPSRNVLNDSGDATIGIARDPASGGISGSGSVLTIVFQAVGKGPTTLTVPRFTMTGSAGQPIPAQAPALAINVK